MLGAIYGDICGCIMEKDNAGTKDTSTTKRQHGYSEITELTLAVAQWLIDDPRHTREGLEQCIRMMDKPEGNIRFSKETIKKIPAAACVSPVGLYATTEEEVTRLADIVAETIGEDKKWMAEAVADCVFINRNEGVDSIKKTRGLMEWLMKVKLTCKPTQSTEKTRQQTTEDCLQAAATAYQTCDTLEDCANHAALAGGNTAAAIACSILAAYKEIQESEPGDQLLRMLPPVLKTILFRFENLVSPPAPTLNSFKVTDNIYAGEYPMMDDDNDDDAILKLKGFQNFGITHFIDLTEKGELKPYKGMLYDGMTHLRFPLKNNSIPSSMQEIWSILEMIDRILETNPDNKVYLHCSDGIGRTGMVVGCLIAEKTGDTVEDNLKKLRNLFNGCPKSLFSTIPKTEEQLMFIQKYTFWKIVRPSKGKPEEPQQAIDLGLPSGTKWARCNVGATKPEDAGDYFTWENRLDAVPKQWKNRWKVPSCKDFMELIENCSHEWTSADGVDGILFTGPNGNSIFLPAAGDRYDCKTFYQNRRGYYWSSTPCRNDSSLAHSLFFFASNTYPVRCYRDRWQPVRLVIA